MSLEKSPIVRKQEDKIAALQIEIKKKNTTIKSLKTRLDKMRERIGELQRKASSSFASAKQKMKEQTEKIIAILARLQKDKRFSKDDRAQFKEMHQEIGGMLEEAQPFGDPEFDYEHDGSEGERAQNFDPFAEFQVAPEPEVQQDLRKLYLQLSKRFHPDRAQNPKETKLFHDIQQEIIRLYQAHDLQGLINMAMQYDLNLLDFSESETDVLEQKIQLLTQQLSGLEQQQERISSEIKNLRKSELGQMLTDVDSFAKEGLDITDAASMTGPALDEMKAYFEVLEKVERTASMAPLVEHELALNNAYPEYSFDDEDYDMDDFFDDSPFIDDFFYFQENPNPKYPVGSWVKFEIIGLQPRKLILVKGQVITALLFPSGEAVYDVSASAETLQKLPPDVFEKMVELDSLGTFKGMPEDMVSSDKAPSKEKIAARYEVLYDIFRKHAFNYLSAKQRKRIFKILDRNPQQLDPQNWHDYIKEELKFPFVGEVIEEDEILTAPRNDSEEEDYDYDNDFIIDIEVQVVGFVDPSSLTNTNVLTIDEDNKERIYSIFDVEPESKQVTQLLEDYYEWFHHYYQTFPEL